MNKKRKLYIGLMRGAMILCTTLTVALVLFLFIMMINATLNFFLKRDKEK